MSGYLRYGHYRNAVHVFGRQEQDQWGPGVAPAPTEICLAKPVFPYANLRLRFFYALPIYAPLFLSSEFVFQSGSTHSECSRPAPVSKWPCISSPVVHLMMLHWNSILNLTTQFSVNDMYLKEFILARVPSHTLRNPLQL